VKLLVRVILLALLAVGALATPANATPDKKLGTMLGQLWTDTIEVPKPDNVFGGGGDAAECNTVSLRGTLAPFGGTDPVCTVKPGTKIFVVGYSVECSTFNGDHNGFGTTATELRKCARAMDNQTAPAVTLDGRPFRLTEVETGVLSLNVPRNNIFLPDPRRTGRSVAHGWVALLHPLTPGRHTIVINHGHDPDPIGTTTILVKPGA
jgi:hypothetical protein